MPFCPKCRDEFQDWVKECPDCKVALVEKLEQKPKPAKPTPPPERNLITVASFSFPTEAYLASAKLEAEGIWSFVADDHIVTTDWLLSNAVGGVKIQVCEPDIKEAIEILRDEEQKSQDTASQAEKCPNCGSTNIQYQTFNMPFVFAVWFVTFLIVTSNYGGGFTFPFMKRKWKCKTCGYQWKNKN